MQRVLILLVVLNRLAELFKLAKIQDSSPHRGEGWGEGDSSIPIPLFSKEGLGEISYTYDKNGNLTKKIEYDDDDQIKRITLYTYDFENRLTKVEIQKGDKLKIVSFTYDPFGRRLSKIIHRHEIDDDDGEKDDDEHEHPRATYYVYDNEDIIMEYNHKGKVTARYVHGLGIDEPLATVLPHFHYHKKGIKESSRVYYYHFDGLGSVTALTDAKGKVVQRYDYDSFGKLKRHGHKVKQSYTYTGREWDKEIELYYYRARYYDPQIGRFINFDPILHPTRGPPKISACTRIVSYPTFDSLKEIPQKLNPFIYVENNPINYKDPSGLNKDCCEDKCVVGCFRATNFTPVYVCIEYPCDKTWDPNNKLLGVFWIPNFGPGFAHIRIPCKEFNCSPYSGMPQS